MLPLNIYRHTMCLVPTRNLTTWYHLIIRKGTYVLCSLARGGAPVRYIWVVRCLLGRRRVRDGSAGPRLVALVGGWGRRTHTNRRDCEGQEATAMCFRHYIVIDRYTCNGKLIKYKIMASASCTGETRGSASGCDTLYRRDRPR